jgi:hypothetical protein
MMPRYIVLVLLGALALFRMLRRSPIFALLGVVLLDRRLRRLAAGVLFELVKKPRLRRLVVRLLRRR